MRTPRLDRDRQQWIFDYLVKERGVDPNRLTIVVDGTKSTTTYQIWLVPPGAETPVPND